MIKDTYDKEKKQKQNNFPFTYLDGRCFSFHHKGELMCGQSNKQPLERPFPCCNDENVAWGIERKKNNERMLHLKVYVALQCWTYTRNQVCWSTAMDSFNFPELRTSEITDGKKYFLCLWAYVCVRVCVKSEIWCVIILPWFSSNFWQDNNVSQTTQMECSTQTIGK